jgi:SAM-dependent methyltransferase
VKVCLKCDEHHNSNLWACPACKQTPIFEGDHVCFDPDLSDTGFPQGAHDRLFHLESNHFWFRNRNRLITWALQKYFPHAKNFFELGCGTGYVLSGVSQSSPHLQLFGSEIHAQALKYALKRSPDATLMQMDGRKIPFYNEFDVIGAFDVLEHIKEDDLVLAQMRKAVRNNGGILVTVPQHEFLTSIVDEYSGHHRRYSRSLLREKVEQAGFEIIKITSFVSLLLPLMLASRSLDKRSLADYDPMSEYRLPKLLNASLESVLSFEHIFIKAGFDFIAGGSLILVARAC